MIKIILSIIIVSIISCNALIGNADLIQEENETETFYEDTIVIRVAIFTDEEENEDFYSQHGRTRYFVYALRNYSWISNEIKYIFNASLLSNKQILNGELTVDNFDVLVYPPEPAWEATFSTGFSNLPKNKKRVSNIKSFIEAGGGYFGVCAGAMIAGNMINTPDTFFEKMWKNSCLGISATNIDFEMATPMLCQWTGHSAAAVGVNGYIQYSGWNTSNYNINYFNGACIDINISHDNPVFQDYSNDTRKVRWNSGFPLIIPEDSDREIKAIARFPDEEICENESLRVHHWKYTGRLFGLFRSFLKGIIRRDEYHFFKDLGFIMGTFVFSEDWDRMNKVVETNVANKPIMTYEIYPNENKSRIILSTAHPEMNVWWGGRIVEVEDNRHNNIFDGFHHWEGMTPVNTSVHDPSNESDLHEFSYNYWIIQRSVALASQKVVDSDLPPCLIS